MLKATVLRSFHLPSFVPRKMRFSPGDTFSRSAVLELAPPLPLRLWNRIAEVLLAVHGESRPGIGVSSP